MDNEDIDRLADELVDSHIADGPKYISIIESVMDGGGSGDDAETVAVKVRQKLARIGTARQQGLI